VIEFSFREFAHDITQAGVDGAFGDTEVDAPDGFTLDSSGAVCSNERVARLAAISLEDSCIEGDLHQRRVLVAQDTPVEKPEVDARIVIGHRFAV